MIRVRLLSQVLESLGLLAGPEEFRRNVRRVSVANLVSRAGSQAANVALIALIYERTNGSGVWLAAVFVSSFVVARIVVGPWVGALGDRFDRRSVMVVSDLAAAVTFIGLAFAQSPATLLALSVCAAVAEAPFSPAASAQTLMLIPKGMEAWATSVRSTARWSGVLIGGVIGGVLVSAVGAPTTFVINAASFVFSAVLALRISGGPYRGENSDAPEHHGVMAGMRHVSRTPALRLSMASIGLGLLGGGMMNVAEYPLFVQLGGGAVAYGIAIAVWGVGGALGAHDARRARSAYGERRALIWGQGMIGAGLIACALIPVTWVVVILFGFAAFGYSAASAASTLIAQRWTPDPIRARVFSSIDTLYASALGISLAVGGATLNALGPTGVFLLGGMVTLMGVVVATRVPPRTKPTDSFPTPEAAGNSDASGTRRLIPQAAF